MRRANLAKSDWRNAVICGVSLEGCNLLRWDLHGGDVRGCSFVDSDLTRASWEDVDARGIDLERATLCRIWLKRVRLHGIHGKPLLFQDVRAEEIDVSDRDGEPRFVSVAELARLLGVEPVRQ
jgi:uncharacterized protein YjbI with pentapeptide repeats